MLLITKRVLTLFKMRGGKKTPPPPPPLLPPLQNGRFYEMTGTCLPVDSQFFLVMVLCFVFLIFCMMVHKCEI